MDARVEPTLQQLPDARVEATLRAVARWPGARGAQVRDAPERVRTCVRLAIEEGRRKRLSSSAWTGHGQPVVLIGGEVPARQAWLVRAGLPCLVLEPPLAA